MLIVDTVQSPAKASRHIPGEEGIWLFIFGDLLVFSLFFITFLFYRGAATELFRAAQTHLNQTLGVLNTLLMLSSSWFVASAIQTARKHLRRATTLLLVMGLLCGLAFVVVKFFEYREKIRAGFTLTSNDFFMYYYMFTGIHLLHVLIGIGVLTVLARYSWSGNFNARKISHLETGVSFWHVVDLLWIVLFALLYLIK